jgi:hypothetical protein
MSHDDPRPQDDRDRGAYTPPTDDLPFNRGGGFDARRTPPSKAPPVTLIVSAAVLLVLIIAVVLFYRSGLRASQDIPPAVGTPVGELKVQAPEEAQPVDPNADVQVYRGSADPAGETPQFTPPPEAVLPRPAPKALPPVQTELPPAPNAAPNPAAPRPAAPAAPATKDRPAAPAPARPATPPAAAATGTSAVQIGAFSSTAVADRQYAAVAARYPQFAGGAQKRVQEVTSANGSTLYRTLFYGLSRERAQAFCAAIKAGGGDCVVR